jgi:hypothetical protein
MTLPESVFTLLHIKMSSFKLGGVPGRLLFTLILMLLLAFGVLQLSVTNVVENFFEFAETAVYITFIMFCVFYWVKTWARADRMLSKASDYEHDAELKAEKHFR